MILNYYHIWRKHQIYKEFAHIQKFTLIQKDTQKNMSHIETTINNFLNNFQKISIKSLIVWIFLFWARKHALLV
jgi:hypothetical protein